MLLQNKTTEKINYLENWPDHYYEVPTGRERKELLTAAISQGLATPSDSYRQKLCEKRFFSRNGNGTADAFMYAWMMIKASSDSGFSFFREKKRKRELESYMELLCLYDYQQMQPEELEILKEEWSDFARCLINACAGSKNYCSTLFGFVRIQDTVIAEKIASEILMVTRYYPARLGLDEPFTPFRQIVCNVYCQMIENGEAYLSGSDSI